MIICAREETSIDYPGKFGQILFTSGCNFRCGFCHNPELITGENNQIDLDSLLKDLKARVKGGWYQAVCISGGEPTLQKDLPEFVKKLKELGILVKIDSNGSNPEMLQILLEQGNVDYVAMDIKSPREKYISVIGVDTDLKKIDKSIEIVKKFPSYEFRTTVLPFMIEEDFEKMGKWVTKKEKVKLWALNQFNPENTFDPEYGKLKPKKKEDFMKLSRLMKKYAEDIKVLVD